MARVENQGFTPKKEQVNAGATNYLRALSMTGAIDDLLDEVAMPEPDDSNSSMLKGGINKVFKHLCKPLNSTTATLDTYLTTLKTDNRLVATHAISLAWA